MKKELTHVSKILVILIALLTAGLVYAATSYRVNTASTVKVDEWNMCKNVNNNTGGGLAVFIPTNTSAEWQRLYTTDTNIRPLPLPSGLTLANCPTVNCPLYESYGSNNYTRTVAQVRTDMKTQVDGWSGVSSGEKTTAKSVIDTLSPPGYNPDGSTNTTSGITSGYSWTTSSEKEFSNELSMQNLFNMSMSKVICPTGCPLDSGGIGISYSNQVGTKDDATGKAVTDLRADINASTLSASYKTEILGKTSQITWTTGSGQKTSLISTTKGNITSVTTIEDPTSGGGGGGQPGWTAEVSWTYPTGSNLCQ